MSKAQQTSFLDTVSPVVTVPTPIRPIHYLGSKLRVLSALQRTIDGLDPQKGRVCDLFAGSGTVAGALAAHRPVVAVDIQEYARVLSSAILRPAELPQDTIIELISNAKSSPHGQTLAAAVNPLVEYEDTALRTSSDDPEPLWQLLEAGPLLGMGRYPPRADGQGLIEASRRSLRQLAKAGLQASSDSLVTRYYGGVYFSFRQAAELDMLLTEVARDQSSCSDMLLAAVLSTASDVVNTVGKQFAQPLKPRTRDGVAKPHLLRMIGRDRSINVFERFKAWAMVYSVTRAGTGQHEVFRADYRDFLETYRRPLGLIYADPPYTRDHYSRYYHVLETLCLRDNPRVSTSKRNGEVRISRGVYREERHQSPFCIVSQAPAAFEALFALARPYEVPLVLSYSPYLKDAGERPRAITMEYLARLARAKYRQVEVVGLGEISHNKIGVSESKIDRKDAELLLVCLP